MRCETCQGMGTSYKLAHIVRIGNEISPGPCPDCGGSGISHCCDGIREQRDPGDETPDVQGCADG